MVRWKNIHAVCCEDNYFPKEKFKLINGFFFHSVYFVFSISLISITDLFAVRYLWDVCNEDKCYCAADILVVSPGFINVRTYCVPIATLNLD